MDASTDSPVDKPPGKIITFYSYKGGTGRSMAVANVAWILASNGKRVLTVDWDLEAPGLHRYYTPFLSDKDLTNSDGLIDLLIEFRDATATGPASGDRLSDNNWHETYADIAAYVVSLDWNFPRGGTLDFLPAGRQGASYSARVNSFDWAEFYERRGGGVFLEAVKEKMRADYDYVLIDSRTGVSDTSDIATGQMPDAVVVCFTLNNQGVKGSAAVAHSIYEQRLRKGREIAIFPVPMRVEPFEKTKLDLRREYSKKMFELFPAHLPPQSRAQFQEDTLVKYLPYYAYEEILATFGNRPGESENTSLLAPAERLTAYLTDFLSGEPISRVEASEYLESRRQAILAVFEGKQVAVDPAQLLIQSADAAWAGLRPDDEKTARRALLRLVRVAEAGEQGGDRRLLVRLAEFDETAQTILRNLGNSPLITIERDTASGDAAVQLSGDELLRHWPRLQSWIQEDREFLLWRQKLNGSIAEWKSLNEDNGALLIGAPLELAKRWKTARAEDLNESELVYIDRCIHEDERRIREQIEREEREKRNAAERTELKQQTEVLIKTSQQTQQRSRLRAVIATGALVLGLAVTGAVLYQKWNDQRVSDELLRRATALTADGVKEAGNKNFDKAIVKYDEAISLNPSYAIAYYSRGRAYLEIKLFDESLADFDAAIRLDANYADAYVGRGDVYWQRRDLTSALTAYNRAIELDPKLSEAYTKRGKVLAGQGSPDKALADFNRAIELSRDDPNAFLWRGSAYSMLRNYDGAFEDFQKALRLNPDLTEVYIKRGDALLGRGRPGDNELAINDYNQAIRQVTYDPKVYLNRANAYRNSGRRDPAIADYQKSLDLNQGERKDAEVERNARAGLQQLKATPPVETSAQSAVPTIYLHYQDANDIDTLKKIIIALRRSKYEIGRNPEQVSQNTPGDVRYFYDEDKSDAERIKQIVERTLKENRIEKTIELRMLKNLAYRVRKGWIEVWLPSLPQPSRDSRRPPENNPYQSRPRSQSQPQKPSGIEGSSAASAAIDLSRAH
jgi:tetratricopeptide (TPR) repeat protein/MinD-like ATPase involved in chromosome partitioning or flagellar assembly